MYILQKLIYISNYFAGEIINPWTGGRLQLSDEIDENSAQDGKSNYCLFIYCKHWKIFACTQNLAKRQSFFYVPSICSNL